MYWLYLVVASPSVASIVAMIILVGNYLGYVLSLKNIVAG